MPQPTQPRFRPSDLLPWADPHIRSLVEQLQQEVRDEQSQPKPNRMTDVSDRIGRSDRYSPAEGVLGV